jgi:hypothetical protein
MLPNYLTVTTNTLYGFGHSQMPGIEHDMFSLSYEAKAILDKEKIQKIVLTGHSIEG